MTAHPLPTATIAVIGLGQIGGSIVKRLSHSHACRRILAHDRDRRLADTVSRHAEWVTDLGAVVQQADLVIISTPVPAIIELLKIFAKMLPASVAKPLILDTGTARQAVQAEAAKHRSRFDHAGFHPLAGAEAEGWDSSRHALFVGRQIVVTPPAKARVASIRELARTLGATLLPMDAKLHDRLVAEAIGLPHLVAFAAQGLSPDNPLRAGSWASLTRVAASNPEMVAGFLAASATEQKRALVRFERELARLKKALLDKSGKSLLRILSDNQRTRD